MQYGPDLEALTRRSKILLQLEPYACYTHQRMLDALLAGGFTLVRSHPINTLRDPGPAVPRRARACQDQLDRRKRWKRNSPPLQEQFNRCSTNAADIRAMGDVVDIVRGGTAAA